jgi:hypothetical protein
LVRAVQGWGTVKGGRVRAAHLVIGGVIVHVTAGKEHGPRQAAGHDCVGEVPFRVEDGRCPLLHPLRVDAKFARNKALDPGGDCCGEEMRHGASDDVNVDAYGYENSVGIFEDLCELGDVVVGAAVRQARALRLEVFERCFVFRVELTADDGQARQFFAEQRVADGSAYLANADDDTLKRVS